MFVKCGSIIRKLSILFFLITSGLVSGKTYYVSPYGNDTSTGLLEAPWLTWGKAFRTASAGDTVYFREGVYFVTSSDQYGRIANSGIEGKYICFFNYPGEYPILDFGRFVAPDWTYAIKAYHRSYLHFKGLTIRNLVQNPTGGYVQGIEVEECHHIILENLNVHHIGGPCISSHGSDEVYLKNCDTWESCDSLATRPGQNGTGIGVGTRTSYTYVGDPYDFHVYIEGCRAWNCSDQGFAQSGVGQHEWKNCWTFNNGRFEGEGWGMKLSIYTASDTINPLSKVVKNCIFAVNASGAINPNNVGGYNFNGHYYNNFIYHNGYKPETPGYVNNFIGCGIWICNYIGTSPGPNEMYVNNISFDNDKDDIVAQDAYRHEYNNWDHPNGVQISNEDFLSLDWTEMLRPRKTDGSLPDINFGKLVPGSDLIDAGTPIIKTRDYNISLPFSGEAPDLGWFESPGTSSSPTQDIPGYISSIIQNATPSRLEMTYNLTLTNIVPATSAFDVKVNNVTRSVSAVAISGTKVLLTLTTPVLYGDVVTVAYIKPASNPLQTAAGGQAASITAQNVTNNVAAVIPAYVSSVIQNATPARLEITYNLSLASVVPAASAFTVKVNNVSRTVSSVAISGTKVLLTLASPVIYGDVVTVAYTKPASNFIQTTSGGVAASITAQNVTNNVAAINNQPPIVSISSPTKSTGFVAPAAITIDANASDPDGSVTKVEFYNGTSKLGEITSAPYSYTWKDVPAGTYSITAAATDNKELKTVSAAVTVIVEKSATTVNQFPSVSVKIPNEKKPKKHDNVVIIAEASDPDGTIDKVELKNGDVTIAEMTTAPYVFTLQNVDTGTYLITAIATDNLGAVSTSDAIELRVEDFYNPDLICLYPNPNNGFFKIDILDELPEQECTLSIIGLTGSTVYKDVMTNEENSREIGLPDLQSGTYVLMLTNGNSIMTTKKFIKQ